MNALVPLGKARALAVIDELLRVSSPLDDEGREGVFFVLRMLFEVPPSGAMPVMHVGGPSFPMPPDPKHAPRFPLVVVRDIPLSLVRGYALGGFPEQPESHVAWFREHGTLRTRPLVPAADPREALEGFLAPDAPQILALTNDVRAYLREQVATMSTP